MTALCAVFDFNKVMFVYKTSWSSYILSLLSNILFYVGRVLVLFVLITGVALATSTADHGKFKELQKHFESGPEVTKACIQCHNKAAKQIHKTKHWTWEFLNPDNKQRLGKKNIVNNYCLPCRLWLEGQ